MMNLLYLKMINNQISEYNNKDRISTFNFTKGQLYAYNELLDFINSSYNPKDYKRALTGAAGTGKTYLVKALIKNCKIGYNNIKLSAPTHKACRVLSESIGINEVKVNSLQSDLGLQLNFDLDKFDINKPPFDPKGKVKIENCSLYIVDESSMINRGLLFFLEDICKKQQCKVLYIGDASQLNPVNELYSAAFRGVKTYTLTEIVRQGENNPISYLLELLRDDIKYKTFKFINYIQCYPDKFNEDNTKGYCVCDDNSFSKTIYEYFNNTEILSNVDYAKVIAYTNHAVSYWNKLVRNAIIKDANKSVITKNDLILSYTNIVNEFSAAIIKNSEDYILKDVVNYVQPKYKLKGFLVKFITVHGGRITSPLFIVDHNDKSTIISYVKQARAMINDALKSNAKDRARYWRKYYDFKDSCLLLTNIVSSQDVTKVEFSRDLDYGFSVTSHKSQGSTYSNVFVDLKDIVYDKFGYPYSNIEDINRRLYVACSRAKNKLFIRI